MMDWLTDPDRVKVQRRLVYLNVAAAVGNFALALWLWRVTSIANVFSGGFSLWIAWTMWKKIPAIKAEQETKIMDYLRGRPEDSPEEIG